MKKALGNLIIIIYIILAIIVTMSLLTYNEYKISVIGDKSLIVIDTDDTFKYKKGDLVIVGREGYEKAEKGDILFFYQNRGVKVAEIQKKDDFGESGVIYTIEGNFQVDQEDIIGTSNNEKVISKVGTILKILQSKWGFLFLIVFPSLIAFLKQLYEFILEISNKK